MNNDNNSNCSHESYFAELVINFIDCTNDGAMCYGSFLLSHLIIGRLVLHGDGAIYVIVLMVQSRILVKSVILDQEVNSYK